MSIPVTSSLTGCSTCRRAFSSMKWKVPSGAEQELERAGVLVADRAARALGRRLHLLARVGVERRRGRLLDELLVPPLDRALALAEREHAAVLVAEHLDLDVARGDERLLDVERPVRERRLRLGARGRVGGLELVGRRARAACPCRRRRRPPSAGRGSRARPRRRAPRRASPSPSVPGHERHAGRLHLRLRARLVAHPLHHVRVRPDEDEVVLLARAHEGRILGRGSRSRGESPRSRSSRRRRSRSRSGGSSRTPKAARCRRRGRRAGRAARRRRRSSRRRPPRCRARGARGSRGRRSRRGSRRGRA